MNTFALELNFPLTPHKRKKKSVMQHFSFCVNKFICMCS